MLIEAVSPTSMVWSDSDPSANGARFGTVTMKLWAAVRPPGSVAVRVTVRVPLDHRHDRHHRVRDREDRNAAVRFRRVRERLPIRFAEVA